MKVPFQFKCISTAAWVIICGPYPHAELNVLASVDFHARIQQTNLAKVFPINHKGAANHSWSSG